MTTGLPIEESQAIAGAILAGGLSTRMGQDKATLQLRDGRTMLEHVASALENVCSRIVVIGSQNPGHAKDYVFVEDLRSQCGPLGGIEALLASGIDPRGQYLICPCDVPAITASVLKMLLERTDRPATVFHIEGNPTNDNEPLPTRISSEALPAVRRLLDGGLQSVWRLMEELRPHVVNITQEQARQLHNVNTMDDLRAMDLD